MRLVGDGTMAQDCSVEATPDSSSHQAERYKTVEPIGKGASCVVYKAHDTILNREVALKYPRYSKLTLKTIKRFQSEARVLACLRSEQLPTLLDFGLDREGKPFMVMELVDGVVLKELIAQPRTLSQCIEIALDICTALEATHQRGVSHRDLTPSNIMVATKNGHQVIKLVDFGLASLADNNDTIYNSPLGTPIYMSPEQAAGRKADHRSDIYALGCIMFELLTGAPPFQAESTAELLSKHIGSAPPVLPRAVDYQSQARELNSILTKCLAKSPRDRFQSTSALKEALLMVRANLKIESGLTEGEDSDTTCNTRGSESCSGWSLLLLSALACMAGGLICLSILTSKPTHANDTLSLSKKILERSVTTTGKTPKKLTRGNFVVPDDRHDKVVASLALNGALSGETFDHMVNDPIHVINSRIYLSPQATDKDLERLRGQKNVHFIGLIGTAITGEGLANLKGSGVESIDARAIPISSKGYKALSELDTLKVLRLGYVKSPARENIAQITHLPSLRSLSLKGTKLNDSCIKELRKIKHLAYLNLDRSSGLSNHALNHIAKIESLRHLRVEHTDWVSRKCLVAFKKLRPDVTVHMK